MGRCKVCGSEGWRVRTNGHGLCKPCGASVQGDVSARIARVKDALVYIRCTRDPVSLLSRCEEAIREVGELVAYEKRGVADIRPGPSSLLSMLEARRDEVAAELQSAESARSRRSAASLAALPGPSAPEVEQDAPVDPPSTRDREDQWWAWDLREGGDEELGAAAGPEGSGAAARPIRERLHCLVLLNPGGIRATLENISMGGLFLSTPRVRPRGSRVRIILNTPDGPVQAEGVVRWARNHAPGGADGLLPGMGIEFTNSPPTLADFLTSRFPSLQTARFAASG